MKWGRALFQWGLPCIFLLLLHPQRIEGIDPSEVKTYLDLDRQYSFQTGANLFIGSSSIRRWAGLSREMAPFPVIQRGFNGATLAGINHVLDRMVYRYAPARVILFAGVNDLVMPTPVSASEVFDEFRIFADGLAEQLPETCLIFIAITPTPTRVRIWPEAMRINELVRDYASQRENILFIKTDHEFLNDSAKPIPELYADDGIHLSARGYSIWERLLQAALPQCS